MVKKVSHQKYGSHYYAATRDLESDTVAELIELLHQPVGKARSVLGGRSSVALSDVKELGAIAVKHFTRGGVFGKFVSKYYLRFGTTRPQREFELMKKVRELGVNAPEPLAFFFQGSLFYRGWLVTREVKDHRTLAELSLDGSDTLPEVVKELARQVELLIESRIFHVDLHPGNVLISGGGSVHLVDFDKAAHFNGTKNLLRDKYLCRWRRAVIKHGLADVLSELFSAYLRKKF